MTAAGVTGAVALLVALSCLDTGVLDDDVGVSGAVEDALIGCFLMLATLGRVLDDSDEVFLDPGVLLLETVSDGFLMVVSDCLRIPPGLVLAAAALLIELSGVATPSFFLITAFLTTLLESFLTTLLESFLTCFSWTWNSSTP